MYTIANIWNLKNVFCRIYFKWNSTDIVQGIQENYLHGFIVNATNAYNCNKTVEKFPASAAFLRDAKGMKS